MRRLGWLLNLGLRAGMIAMLVRVLRAGPADPRYSAKGIGPRALAITPVASLAIPLAWLRHQRGRYPVWMDDLYLSVFALDLAGNVFDLYDSYEHFDLVPHAHGTGAATVLSAWALGAPMLSGIGVATVIHVALEVQEYASDVVFGYRNVRGTWDVIGDLSAGLVGTAAYAVPYVLLVRGRGREPAPIV